VGNALLLDLGDVAFSAAQSISVLVAVDDACHSAGLPWALITSHAVDRVLRIGQDDDILSRGEFGARRDAVFRPPDARPPTGPVVMDREIEARTSMSAPSTTPELGLCSEDYKRLRPAEVLSK
jgi:hypothetical protein